MLPLLAGAIALGTGIAAGLAMKPQDETVEADDKPPPSRSAEATEDLAYMKFPAQFVVPLVTDAEVRAVVVLGLSVEASAEAVAQAYAREPKLRDAFLRTLFDHANAGGFDGDFTRSGRRSDLRRALLEAARGVVGDGVADILVTDMVRQDGRSGLRERLR